MSNENITNGRGSSKYAGLLVSNNVRRIWITLTIAESFFSLSKILDSSCSTVSCLRRTKMNALKSLANISRAEFDFNSSIGKNDNTMQNKVKKNKNGEQIKAN